MKTNQELYEDLLIQYEKLTELEKNSILIYKSKLFIIINSITKIPGFENLTPSEILNALPNKDECLTVFSEYSKVLSDLKNIFIKNSIFSNIRFNNIESFIEDIKITINTLNGISTKVFLEEDTVVYRSILVDKNKQFDFINDSPSLISTSIKVEDAEQFLNSGEDKEKHFYSIKLEKGMPVMVSPFSIIRKYDSIIDSIQSNSNYTLAISSRNTEGQQEITLFKDLLSYKEYDSRIVQTEEEIINIHYIEVYQKENTYQDNELKTK